MPDKEKVIKGLREMSCRATWEDIDRIRHIFQPIINDAIALLREQEPVEPITAREGRNKYWSYYVCPNCNDDLNYGQKYCCECGKKVKWDEAIQEA